LTLRFQSFEITESETVTVEIWNSSDLNQIICSRRRSRQFTPLTRLAITFDFSESTKFNSGSVKTHTGYQWHDGPTGNAPAQGNIKYGGATRMAPAQHCRHSSGCFFSP